MLAPPVPPSILWERAARGPAAVHNGLISAWCAPCPRLSVRFAAAASGPSGVFWARNSCGRMALSLAGECEKCGIGCVFFCLFWEAADVE